MPVLLFMHLYCHLRNRDLFYHLMYLPVLTLASVGSIESLGISQMYFRYPY